jgi:dihydroorotase
MPGVQTLLPLMLNHVHDGKLTLDRLVDLVCAGPARLYNIAGKGRIARGFDADLTLVDLKAERTLSDDQMHSKVGWTPFAGMRVVGWPKVTIVGGHIAMRDDEVFAPAGTPVAFSDVPLASA